MSEQNSGRKTVRVTPDQVSAARALIQLRGGVDKVDELTAMIASARPATTKSDPQNS